MNISHLRSFLAIAETGNMTKAAEKLGVQQPPLSHRLKLLEAGLGLELFRRHARGMSLTEGGKLLLPEAQRVLADVDDLEQRMIRFSRGFTGRVRFGFAGSAAAHPLMGEALGACRRQYPEIEVLLSETPSVIDGLLTGKLHCGLLRTPGPPQNELAFHTLLREPLVVALPKGHALAAGPRSRKASQGLTLLDLRDEGFIIGRQPGSPGFYTTLFDACRKKGFEPRIAAEVGRVHTSLNLVAAGVGISIVPQCMSGVNASGIEYRPLAEPRMNSPLVLAWRKQDEMGAIATFVKLIRTLAAERK
ncbi:MAG: LysR family transcriptional regulator [Pseudomonadota bacterium]